VGTRTLHRRPQRPITEGMQVLLLLILTFVFFVAGLYGGGFMAMICWGMSVGSFLLALD
jgi:hypothetical protein